MCSLIWDEMAIQPSLTYLKKGDRILGFVDGQNRIKIADHAMVFLVRGLYKKWKQPLAYYFTESTMPAAEIAKCVKALITCVQNTGLEVVATVCDQLSTNISAIRMLKEETRQQCLRNKMEDKYVGFLINQQEIVPLYDPPHLLKGIRNNLLKADVHYQWKSDMQVASWKDIVSLYELDTGDHDIRFLHKLSDHHIYPDRMKKMKVKIAAQVFSRSVYSVMIALSKYGNFNNNVLLFVHIKHFYLVLGNCRPPTAQETAILFTLLIIYSTA